MNKKRKTRLVERDKLKKKSSAMRWALLLLFVFFSGLSANAQDTKKTVTLSGEYSVREVFAEVKKQAGYTVSYNNERLDAERRLRLDFKNASVTAVMDKVLEGTGLRYEILNDFIILSVGALFRMEIPFRERPSSFMAQRRAWPRTPTGFIPCEFLPTRCCRCRSSAIRRRPWLWKTGVESTCN